MNWLNDKEEVQGLEFQTCRDGSNTTYIRKVEYIVISSWEISFLN